jgi:hypothetical protein
MNKLILIGYWYSEDEEDINYPNPTNLIDVNYYKENYKIENNLVAYLMSGKPCNFYRGYSKCRICNKKLGYFERTDGGYIWPDQLEHYILEHNVLLPKEFIDYVMKQDNWPTYEIDDTFWKAWKYWK